MNPLDELAKSMLCLEATDKNTFQRRARVLQAIWREQQGYPIGACQSGRRIGSYLEMPWAEERMANFLDDDIRRVVQQVRDSQSDQLIQWNRMFDNLLSSQPMAFNLFAHLRLDLQLASDVFRQLTEGRIHTVTAVEFEHAPARGDARYTGDRSAFDVYVLFRTRSGCRGFAGIEVKYHENLSQPPSRHHARYDEVAQAMGCFRAEAYSQLQDSPLQQIWRDHLLAGAHRMADDFTDGFFAFLSPEGNTPCNTAIDAYRKCLHSEDSFVHWTLETVVDSLRGHTEAVWVDAFADRYISFGKVDAALGSR